ncbi:MAG: DUF1820 family protein [Pseudomonadota bacterium]|jgi:hypothetical protein|nr:DUF1820 family protein [Gammaproteobacteria bacterium]MEC9357793.1 DUF1820 family protein [Pseudomonadota bacterium]
MTKQRLYRVSFVQQGQVYELYARQISHGGLLGFVEVEQIVFGEKSSVVVDPTEERLKSEFENVERFYVPVHQIVRIDEVKSQGAARIKPVAGDSSKVTPFPMFTPGGGHQK